jgi:hypothetical protein
VEFGSLNRINYKFDTIQNGYIKENESKVKRKIVFMHDQIVVVSAGKTEASYKTSAIGTEVGSDRLEFTVREGDAEKVLLSLNADSIEFVSKDFKIIYQTDLIHNEK